MIFVACGFPVGFFCCRDSGRSAHPTALAFASRSLHTRLVVAYSLLTHCCTTQLVIVSAEAVC